MKGSSGEGFNEISLRLFSQAVIKNRLKIKRAFRSWLLLGWWFLDLEPSLYLVPCFLCLQKVVAYFQNCL